ncbi:MAG: IscS subfamily cysteine desulfurase [Deltaproteobacteria bacterium]|nr:IscS subfamily cysteine desulfurase [Deltaproteobacteria bacterium]
MYLDHHSTTPLDPRVLEAMMPYLTERFGNAASRTHAFGWEAEEGVEKARAQVAALIGANAKDIVWTSGATESDNLAIKGALHFYRDKGRHIVTMATEHKAVLDSCKALGRDGLADVTALKPRSDGILDVAAAQAAITDATVMVSVMHANNEIGVVQPIAELGALCRAKGVLLHTDAAQSAGKIAIDVEAMHVDLLSLSAHKMYGPKGVGALYVRSKSPRVRLTAQIDGGGHERGLRSGTLNVAGIVGMGAACAIAKAEMAEEATRLLALRERLRARLFGGLDQLRVNGDLERRLPGSLNVSFACVEGESLMMGLRELAVSSGSACSSATLEPSYVLRAIGVGEELAHSSIRFGIGRFNTEDEIDYAAGRVIAEVRRLRALSPFYKPATKIPAAEAPR